MEISGHVRSRGDDHTLTMRTGDAARSLAVPAGSAGRGSAVNGGELLMAALATCYCNDLYREAERLGIAIDGCEVAATASFNGIGLAAERIRYAARVESSAPQDQVEHLLSETDRLAEIHNTLRAGCPVERVPWRDPAP